MILFPANLPVIIIQEMCKFGDWKTWVLCSTLLLTCLVTYRGYQFTLLDPQLINLSTFWGFASWCGNACLLLGSRSLLIWGLSQLGSRTWKVRMPVWEAGIYLDGKREILEVFKMSICKDFLPPWMVFLRKPCGSLSLTLYTPILAYIGWSPFSSGPVAFHL